MVGEGLENEAEARECREESREVTVFRGTVVWEGRRVSRSGGEEIVVRNNWRCARSCNQAINHAIRRSCQRNSREPPGGGGWSLERPRICMAISVSDTPFTQQLEVLHRAGQREFGGRTRIVRLMEQPVAAQHVRDCKDHSRN